MNSLLFTLWRNYFLSDVILRLAFVITVLEYDNKSDDVFRNGLLTAGSLGSVLQAKPAGSGFWTRYCLGLGIVPAIKYWHITIIIIIIITSITNTNTITIIIIILDGVIIPSVRQLCYIYYVNLTLLRQMRSIARTSRSLATSLRTTSRMMT